MKFFNKNEKRIIELLIQRDETLSELSKKIGISKPATSKHLKNLEDQHIIKGTYERTAAGRTISYSLLPFHIVFSIDPTNKILVNFKANDILDTTTIYLGYIKQKEFREEVKQYLKNISTANLKDYIILLYGSVAEGSAHRKSDIDILFLKESWSKKQKEQILDSIATTANNCNHLAKPLFKTKQEYKQMDITLQTQIKEHGIILYETGTQWDSIKQQLKKYKSITI